MSCIELISGVHLHFESMFGTHAVKCPQYRGVLISGVSFKRGSTVAVCQE